MKYKNRDPILETSGEIVGFYPREFYPLDNFSSFAVEWRGRKWQTSEHAYQASHFLQKNPKIVEEIFNARSAHDAQKIARKYEDKIDSDFYKKNLEIMQDILRHKLQQNPYVEKKLRQTGDKKIVEDSPKDNFWGWGAKRDGKNELGKIWMKLRDELPNLAN
ncbi:MAG: hypothetical protein A3F94_01760 [Candidatus Spechtbacteria bacterium RIFCSPLOWO2_12_FULL_38_22]|uniref:NADAR domain-containing protein n=1 Tax=Candidatus Spechtbacteria bacterium RIFCSPLOWO2_12_FULL_38_22 TaxID=1802165 RepID=A0A1G2HJ89_9BACT|nr:MAG: hypothetical protein A2728_00295 [Candidatus Spechtbacteria bacterium RIFCSPHIGHO2_01_FULL_38_11]OGZ59278.1 MAG: hypothetical protein A3A00_01615 [Candidatus Spechtbacteria bacterium RIFCSPLOWO2_01_FULL_38_20]OGZ60286.1 MAG: hypothetical protein A3E58_01245 [Candidatus Spechtbacteria bacterium RIFCSPHIGHO2_12_FULL_38_30]OGZ62489.1 MAG: hypothetical protein A3F94_01760 [Candidatus Spechtbacteria bacterium RIFCSPLOWO2_12_FULL_38_22]